MRFQEWETRPAITGNEGFAMPPGFRKRKNAHAGLHAPKEKPGIAPGFCRQSGGMFGGDGGNRTRVQKHSTDSSTYLALPFDLTRTTRTRTLRTGESPIV